MGFFSFKCAKSKFSIPAYPHAGLPIEASRVVMVTPQNERVEGIYDGYGHINDVDVYAKMALHMFGEENRDLIWEGGKRVIYKGKDLGTISAFMWDQPISIDQIETMKAHKLNDVLGKTMNELAKTGYKFRTRFDDAQELIKIVRADHYNGESFEELPVSKNCKEQGFFYERATARKIFLSLITLKKEK